MDLFQRVSNTLQQARLTGLRIGTVLLLSTFIDDGVREVSDFHAQLGYLSNPLNHIRLTGAAGYLYVAWSMATQLLAGGYLLVCVLLSPSALLSPAAERSTWRCADTARSRGSSSNRLAHIVPASRFSAGTSAMRSTSSLRSSRRRR